MAVDDPTRTDGAADQAPTKPSPTHGKEQAVRTVLWAVGVTLLSNAANILKQLRDVLESMVQLQALALDHVWLSAVVLSGAIIWGNVLLFRFLYHRLRRRVPTTYKVLAAVGSLAFVTVVVVTNLYSLKSLLGNPVDIQRELLNELATVQTIEGGFRNATTPEGVPDPWTTAQSLKAILLAETYNTGRIKQAFYYIESKRQHEGFVVTPGPDTKPFIRSEITAWVAVAYLESLSKSGLWTDKERTATIGLVENTLHVIVAQQDRASGGWTPIPHAVVAHERTYATTMAVWALTEALLSRDLPSQTKEGLVPAFDAGISWLMNHYVSNLGWEENPKYALGKPFPGLTYQVLFVLERAQLVSEHNSFKNTEAFRRIKRELKNIIHTAQVGDVTSVPTNYIMVGEYSCWADVLAYPWLLAVLPELIADNDVSSDDRRFLGRLLRDELGKVTELPSDLVRVETYQVAENIIGVSCVINFEQRTK
jgi:hypothetical protein